MLRTLDLCRSSWIPAAPLAERHAMTHAEMNELIAKLSRSICYGKVRKNSIFVTLGVNYPNGVGVAVRVDANARGSFTVSDDCYASVIAEDMRASSNLRRVAAGVTERTGVSFDNGCFYVSDVEPGALPSVISTVANASSHAMERVLASLEQPRFRRSRELFDKRLSDAFGDLVRFNISVKGNTGRDYDFSAGVVRDGLIVRLFELVFPSTPAVALANMKISDVLAAGAPNVTAALADYQRTDPTLRSILSAAGGIVIAANDDVAAYRLAS